MPSPDPGERTLIARQASYTSWAACEDRSARTEPGRAALRARFDAQVDPDNVLDPRERARRAEAARKAHFTKLALASARSRRRAAEARRSAAALDRQADEADRALAAVPATSGGRPA